jgi:hypothetical protein
VADDGRLEIALVAHRVIPGITGQIHVDRDQNVIARIGA